MWRQISHAPATRDRIHPPTTRFPRRFYWIFHHYFHIFRWARTRHFFSLLLIDLCSSGTRLCATLMCNNQSGCWPSTRAQWDNATRRREWGQTKVQKRRHVWAMCGHRGGAGIGLTQLPQYTNRILLTTSYDANNDIAFYSAPITMGRTQKRREIKRNAPHHIQTPRLVGLETAPHLIERARNWHKKHSVLSLHGGHVVSRWWWNGSLCNEFLSSRQFKLKVKCNGGRGARCFSCGGTGSQHKQRDRMTLGEVFCGWTLFRWLGHRQAHALTRTKEMNQKTSPNVRGHYRYSRQHATFTDFMPWVPWKMMGRKRKVQAKKQKARKSSQSLRFCVTCQSFSGISARNLAQIVDADVANYIIFLFSVTALRHILGTNTHKASRSNRKYEPNTHNQ